MAWGLKIPSHIWLKYIQVSGWLVSLFMFFCVAVGMVNNCVEKSFIN